MSVTRRQLTRSVRWLAQAHTTKGYMVTVGTFDTQERAAVAVNLYRLWLKRGFTAHQIPARPRTIDAI